jgi:large subunit ribosomal protein L22
VTGPKTNERPGTRAVLRHFRMSATKARQVLDLIRGQDVDRAADMLRTTPREAARVVAKVLDSAVANARHNDGIDPEELYVSACFADEGTTLKRWRPRARGRATRIRKRTCHITVIVSRLPEERLQRRRARQASSGVQQRSRRVAASRREETVSAAPVTEAGEWAGDAAEQVAGAPEAVAAETAGTDTPVADAALGQTDDDGDDEGAGDWAETVDDGDAGDDGATASGDAEEKG